MMLMRLILLYRVKAIDIISIAIPPYSDSKSATYASTVSSDGFIRVYDMGDVSRALHTHVTEHPVVVEPVTQYDTKGSRLTCVTMGDGELVADSQQVGKRKRDEGNEEADASEEDEDRDAREDAEDTEDNSEKHSE